MQRCYIHGLHQLPVEKHFAFGGSDGKVHVRDYVGMEPEKVFDGHSDEVHVITSTANGKYIISGSGDKTIRAWDISTLKQLSVLKASDKMISNIHLTPNDEFLVCDSGVGNIGIWKVPQSLRE
nr:hypothetical protein [Candidatus Sigynarchaeota archaeon]